MVEVMKIMETSFERSHAGTAAQCPQPCLRPAPAHASSGDCWTLMGKSGQSFVGSLLFSPGSWCTQILFVPSKSLFPQFCVSSGSSMVGLMATSSKRAYALPKSDAPRAPASAAVHCWSIPPRRSSNTALSQSLWSL